MSMRPLANNAFDKTDAVLERSLNHRLNKHNVIVGNLTNANTPGYRAMGYDFESQLSAAVSEQDASMMRTTNSAHVRRPGLNGDGDVKADLFVKPTESIGNDGNTVDVDQEMADLAWNQTAYRATVELLNRKMAMMRYGINGGR